MQKFFFLLEFILWFLNKFTDAGVQTLFWYSLEIVVFFFFLENSLLAVIFVINFW